MSMRKLLIANRGEIACRIIASARTLGWQTVAVHSQADEGALHVKMADQSVNIGEPAARHSYLRIDKLIEAARTSGASAVHPGYGFLSENARFAAAVIDAGLLWVGPSPDTIRLMGDKQSAREAALRAGVPVVPGSRRFSHGDLVGIDEAASEVGFPLLAKASAGGGGIGMRRIDLPSQLVAQAAMVQDAAHNTFGDGTVYLERYLERARHVEVQVFGFGDGSAVHLFERDCSLQRRFQKVIEETPAPGLPANLLQAMYDASLRMCAETKYAGAGTVEFIVDEENCRFYFLEMNTRIQVEHAVTEMVTGLDLVAMQLRLAAQDGGQGKVVPRRDGAAIECRLYAENPAKRFLPSPGKLDVFSFAVDKEGVRVDTGYREGDVVTPFYDPLIAKFVTHGPDRATALARMRAALDSLQVAGIVTNRDFLLSCLSHPEFLAGKVYTRFIDDFGSELVPTS